MGPKTGTKADKSAGAAKEKAAGVESEDQEPVEDYAAALGSEEPSLARTGGKQGPSENEAKLQSENESLRAELDALRARAAEGQAATQEPDQGQGK